MNKMKINDTFDRIIFRIKNYGFFSLFNVFFRKISEYISPSKSKYFESICKALMNSKGLEIGGPSKVFKRKGFFPIYPFVSQLDNINFSSTTIWEGEINSSNFIVNGQIMGNQFINDATDLSFLPDKTYDYILSSEMLQHLANPIKALNEWKRVLKEGSYLVLIIPNKEKTFDHLRNVTTLEHLISDFENETQEDDLTHLPEVLKYHDLSMDRLAGSYKQFKERCENNLKFRGIHHHVFNLNLVIELLEYSNFKILGTELHLQTIFVLGQLNNK